MTPKVLSGNTRLDASRVLAANNEVNQSGLLFRIFPCGRHQRLLHWN